MSGWNSSRPPWETQDQPALPPDDTWYGGPQGPRVVIKPHDSSRSPRYAQPPRQASRGVAFVGVVVGLAASVALAAGAVRLTRVTWGEAPPAAPTITPPISQNASATPPVPTPTAAATPSSTTTAGSGTGTTLSYVLTAPKTAGGYTLTSPMSATVKAIGTAGATALMTAVEAAGGKPASNVSGQYLIFGDQYLGYAGYNGTFSPAAVLQAFTAGASGAVTEPAGPHGGKLACGQVTGSSSAASTGEACVWATTTTVGMVEFFGSGGTALETVLPAKAAADTVKFRADVEAKKP